MGDTMENILNKIKTKKIVLFITLLISFLFFEVIYLLFNNKQNFKGHNGPYYKIGKTKIADKFLFKL